MAHIDRSSKTPIYRQIYDDINLHILHGEYSLGSMLPSESKLCSIYGVERATVRRALAMMVDDGKISKIPGLGTSVLNPTETNEPSIRKTLLFLLPKGLNDADRSVEPFNAKLMRTIEHECVEKGYDLLYKSFALSDTADDIVRACNPAGVFFTSYLPTDMYKNLHMKGIPVVLINQSHPIYPSVSLDNIGGARMVMEYLLALGHRKIGYLGVSSDHQIQVNRLRGYKETLEANGLSINADWMLVGDWSMDSGKSAMRRLISKGNLPTALFVANDAMAIGAIMTSQDSGISIPGDISIVGFDNIDQSAYIRPTLTTVAFDYNAMSRAACMMMFDMIDHNNKELNVNIYVPLTLIDRESARKVDPI